MRKMILAALAILALAPAAALAQQKVTSDYDTSYDFSKIKTFNVKVATTWNDPISEKRVVTEIEETLASKGWTKADETKADALVLLHGATEQKKRLNAFYDGGGAWGWGGMGSGMVTEQDYIVGTLVVDIFDAKTKNVIFRGTASDELGSTVEKNTKKLEKATYRMFYEFPPETKKK